MGDSHHAERALRSVRFVQPAERDGRDILVPDQASLHLQAWSAVTDGGATAPHRPDHFGPVPDLVWYDIRDCAFKTAGGSRSVARAMLTAANALLDGAVAAHKLHDEYLASRAQEFGVRTADDRSPPCDLSYAAALRAAEQVARGLEFSVYVVKRRSRRSSDAIVEVYPDGSRWWWGQTSPPVPQAFVRIP